MAHFNHSHHTTLITGASSGLGAEFARQLAARGSNLVLVARRADRLEALATELTQKYKVHVTPVAFDLGTPDAGRRLRDELRERSLRVTSLVNCAGFGTHNAFADEDPDRMQAQLTLNIASLVDINHAFLPQLTGALVNIASMLGYQPWPTAAVYGASKSFVLNFTEALWQETRAAGSTLKVLALSPGPTRTEFFDVAGSQEMSAGAPMQTPEQVVRTALRTLDRRNTPPSVVSGGINKLISLSSRFLTRRHTARLFGRITSH
jgi:short-subunit dehydrogenase